jgi:hypothetical protein
MAPILRRAGSIATGGKHREYRIECNHTGPRFIDSTASLLAWLNRKQNDGPCQDVFYNYFKCLRHFTPFDSNRGPLDSKRRLPTAYARHFNRRSRRNGPKIRLAADTRRRAQTTECCCPDKSSALRVFLANRLEISAGAWPVSYTVGLMTG